MAPIPTKLDEEAVQLIEASERLEKDILEIQVPRLRQGQATNVEREEIRDDLEKLSKQIEELFLLVDDQTGERNRRKLSRIVDEKRERLRRLRQDARDALLVEKRIRDTANREELLKNAMRSNAQLRAGNASDDVLMEANNNVTEGLRRVVNVMQGELEKSVLSVQMLETSTKTLQSTSLTHSALEITMDTSKSLINALSRADKWDRATILAAFAFFLLVVAFVLKQRVLDRSLRIAFWWTRFIPDFGKDAELLKNAEAGAIVSSIVSSVSITSSSLLSSPQPSPFLGEPASMTALSDILESTIPSSSPIPVSLAEPSPEDITSNSLSSETSQSGATQVNVGTDHEEL